jgi:hypothetical protein
MLLPVGILVATCFEFVMVRIKVEFFKWLLIGLMLVLLTTESMFYERYKTLVSVWTERQTLLKNLMPKVVSNDAILYVTWGLSDRSYDFVELDAMQFAQDLRLPTLNGYSGSVPSDYSKPNPCVDFKDRLNTYFAFKQDGKLIAEDLAGRVLVLSPEKCPNQPAVKTNIAIDKTTASQINLRLEPNVSGRTLNAKVFISNDSLDQFSTLSTKGPVRMSWRFVGLDSAERPQSEPDWSTRKDLYFTLQPGATQTETILTELPTLPGDYLFEVSLVQDGVAWFHNLGMSVAQWRVEIK